MGQWRSD